ncbi:hypothetical protein, partial [Stenotrophomonas maltophilia]|uniref:hypothetical protein n=1 Tax=Stenotrophomonas maltophilia TaxID=40324 RepID=UPI0019532FBF
LALPLFTYVATVPLFGLWFLSSPLNDPGRSSFEILIFTLFVGTVFYVVALISHVISYPLLIFAAFFLFKRMGRVRL